MIVLGLHAFAVFLGAALLFAVELLAGKMLLPVFGGAPAVWTTSIVFFQGALLLGYLAAHLIATRLPPRAQAGAFALLLGAALLSLPPGTGSAAPDVAHPITSVLVALARGVGVPFVALAAAGPLLQSWFARSSHRSAGDPYFLYALSNLGSMIALLAYPFAVEPRLGLHAQARTWSWAFALVAAAAMACALGAARAAAGSGLAASPLAPAPRPSLQDRLRWMAMAFVPSSLLMGVTLYLTTDVAPVPLLWVVPLALYLLAFALAFSRWMPKLRVASRAAAIGAGMVVLFLLLSGFRWPTSVVAAWHFGALFALSAAWLGELASRRPSGARLTEFYLWVSLGGVLGGVFNGIAAPLLFDSTAEYPLVMVAAVALLPAARKRPPVLDALAAAVVAAFGWWLISRGALDGADLEALGAPIGYPSWRMVTLLSYALPLAAAALLLAARMPRAFALSVAALAVISTAADAAQKQPLLRARSFFGVLSVEEDDSGCRTLWSGKTPHGRQRTSGDRGVPLSFYQREGPIGEVMGAFRGERVAVVGLGIGTLAAYGQAGQRWTFYEIDPAVVEVARDRRLFTYLSSSAASLQVEVGDARLNLRDAPRGWYGLLILDAFASDAIPVHLIGREAFELYLDKLAPGGLLALHVTNRYLSLEPIVSRMAAELGLAARIKTWSGGDGCAGLTTTWVVLARDVGQLGPLASAEGWSELAPAGDAPLWTDDFSDIAAVAQWDSPW